MSSARIETVVVDGLALANQIRDELARAVARHRVAGRRAPRLGVVLVGDDPASASYIMGKRRACERVGMDSIERRLPATAGERAVLAAVEELNRAPVVDGILVQLPLPKDVRPNTVAEAIDPEKDVDGLHPRRERQHEAAAPVGVERLSGEAPGKLPHEALARREESEIGRAHL